MRTDKFTALCPAPLRRLCEVKKVLLPVLSVQSEAQQSPKPPCPPTVLTTTGFCSQRRYLRVIVIPAGGGDKRCRSCSAWLCFLNTRYLACVCAALSAFHRLPGRASALPCPAWLLARTAAGDLPQQPAPGALAPSRCEELRRPEAV